MINTADLDMFDVLGLVGYRRLIYEDGDDAMLTQPCCRRTEAAEQLPKHYRVQRHDQRGGDRDPRGREYGVHINEHPALFYFTLHPTCDRVGISTN
jgi:hypothetical protein